jgi:hypothetical protein
VFCRDVVHVCGMCHNWRVTAASARVRLREWVGVSGGCQVSHPSCFVVLPGCLMAVVFLGEETAGVGHLHI